MVSMEKEVPEAPDYVPPVENEVEKNDVYLLEWFEFEIEESVTGFVMNFLFVIMSIRLGTVMQKNV